MTRIQLVALRTILLRPRVRGISAASISAGYDPLVVLRELWDQPVNPDLEADFALYVFRAACELGQLQVAQWAHSLGYPVDVAQDHHLLMACEYQWMDMARWLWSLYPEGEDYSAVRGQLFLNACLDGNLVVARWVWSIGPRISNQTMYLGFYRACYCGSIELAQCIWSLNPRFGIRDDDSVFRTACKSENLPLAQWIW